MSELERLRAENARLKALLAQSTSPDQQQACVAGPAPEQSFAKAAPLRKEQTTGGLTNAEIKRFSRQLLVKEVGMRGQERLKKASVMIVGAGGLGSPVALYLAAAGIGKIGLIDHDVVDLSNLHRQIMHGEASAGQSKVASAATAIRRLNTQCELVLHDLLLTSEEALDILRGYDVLVDATDNVATRYLLNDAAILLKLPLVSGSALQLNGQLTTYGFESGPCYRCIYPSPPPPETVTNCSDGGVIGPVCGLIGSMQALEVIRILAERKSSYAGKLFLFQGGNGSIKTVRLRARRTDCAICGDTPRLHGLVDYTAFCGSGPNDGPRQLSLLAEEDRRSVQWLHSQKDAIAAGQICLVDTRDEVQYQICALPHTTHVPLDSILANPAAFYDEVLKGAKTCAFICRRGNSSQEACVFMKKWEAEERGEVFHGAKWSETTLRDTNGVLPNHDETARRVWIDVAGGLEAWAEEIDPTFPIY